VTRARHGRGEIAGVLGAGAAVASARRATPTAIAGLPTELTSHDLGAFAIRLVAVRDLESQLDRERLLADEEYEPPYWALLWSGSALLARQVAESFDCTGRWVLDAGCGLGLTALAAARRGGAVVALDRDRTAVQFVRASAQENELRVMALAGDLLELPFRRRFEIILAGEILYDAAGFDRLANALSGALAPGGVLWIADARRVDTAGFFAAAERWGLTLATTRECEVREEGSLVRVHLSQWRRPEVE